MECDYKLSNKVCKAKTDCGVCKKHIQHRPNLVSVCETIGRRESMEDQYVINRNDKYEIYGVFDGHGGPEASKFVKDYFQDFNLDKIERIEKMAKTFHEIILGLHHLSVGNVKNSGTTASIVVIYKKLNKMIAINIGDSRIMIFGETQSKIITKDHNVGCNRKDVKKISSKGGIIEDNYLMGDKGSVNLTRTIGDHEFNELIRLPEICIVDIVPVKKILISCDGLWEETSKQKIDNIVNKGLPPAETCKKLVDQAYSDGSGDNITVMVIYLGN